MSWPSTTAASPSSASSFADHPFTPVSDKESVEDAFDRQDDVEFEDLGQDSTLLRYEDTGDAIAGAERNDLGDEDDRNHALLAGRRKRRRRSSVQSYELYTPEEERAVARKLDTKLALYVAFLYLLSFLDRGNLGASIPNILRTMRTLPFQNGHSETWPPSIPFIRSRS